MWWQLFLLVLSHKVRSTGAVRCLNGTFCYTRYHDDPLELRGLLWPTKRDLAQLYQSLTVDCGVISWCVTSACGLLCYNCSGTQAERPGCAGAFVSPAQRFNNTRLFLVNCTGETAMCFVRSWRARGEPAWIVQRGCYTAKQADVVPPNVTEPTRAMTCRRTRLPEAEYKLCLCKADWCNVSRRVVPLKSIYLLIAAIGFIT